MEVVDAKKCDIVIKSRRVFTSRGTRPAAIVIRDSRIYDIRDYDFQVENQRDYGDLIIMPGIVDSHVHVNEPGRTEWEGFLTATKAAAAGGITTIVDMPLNSIPPTTTMLGLKRKQESAAGQCWIDVGFWGGVVPGNDDQIQGLADGGVLGFKSFWFPPGSTAGPGGVSQDVRFSGDEDAGALKLRAVFAVD